MSDLLIDNQTQIQDQEEFPTGARSVINIYAKSNESLYFKILWQKKNGLSIDLSNYTALMEIRDRKDGHVVLARLGTGPDYDGRITLGYDGSILCQLDASYLKTGYATGTWKYDIVLEDPNGVKTRITHGKFYIDRSCSYLEG